MSVVVTGASGHVGSNLVRALLAQGQSVRTVLHDQTAGVEGLDVERVAADVRDPESLRGLFEGAEYVFHLAAVISIDGDKNGLVPAVNVQGARNVAEACLAQGVGRLVHCSSIHAFDQEPLDQALDETRSRADERPGHPAYDTSKSRGERQVREVIAKGLDAVIVNPTAVLGPNDFEGSRMGRVIVDLCLRKLPASIDGGFDWVDVRDVCAGAINAAKVGRTGESYLLGGRWESVAGLAKIVEGVTQVAPPRLEVPMWLARVGAPFVVAYGRVLGQEPLYSVEALRALRANRQIDCTKARTELGHDPRDLETTVRDSVRWFIDNGRLPAGLL